MGSGAIGIAVQEPDPASALAAIERYEAAGVPAVWLTTGGAGPDGLTLFAAAAARTKRILLGTAITPILPRHPLVVAQQVSVIAALAPGRFRLGIGVSHKPGVEATFGLDFDAPLGHLREYVAVLRAALDAGSVDFDGSYYHAHARLPAPPSQPVPIMASALRRGAFELCGEIADGAITWLCPFAYVRDVGVPAVSNGAVKAGRTPPPLIAHVPFAVSTDAGAVREAARQQLRGISASALLFPHDGGRGPARSSNRYLVGRHDRYDRRPWRREEGGRAVARIHRSGCGRGDRGAPHHRRPARIVGPRDFSDRSACPLSLIRILTSTLISKQQMSHWRY